MEAFLRHIRKLCILSALAALPLAAQTGRGIVTGRISDPSGAAVQNATVVLENTATGVAQRSQTNQSGIYYVGSLPIGAYVLDVEAPGFQKFEGNLQVGRARPSPSTPISPSETYRPKSRSRRPLRRSRPKERSLAT